MKQFESTWRKGYEFFERYFDTDLNRSVTSKIDLPHEWYEESSKGLYSYILDENIKLDKKQGNAKRGRDQYGFLDPMYRNIRDNYWERDGGYNTTPRIWYLDIETRVSRSYKNTSNKELSIRNKITGHTEVLSVKQIQHNFYNGGDENFEVFDTLNNKWVELKQSIYLERNNGFPKPEKSLEEISMFQIYDNKDNVMILLGLRPWVHEKDYVKEFDFPIKYIHCKNEIEMINTYLAIFKKLDPLIIYAWNGSGFDFPYIHNRIEVLGLDTSLLSNHGDVSYSEGLFQGQIDFKFKADGHFYIDLLDVYKKFTFTPLASYALDNVADFELNERKVSHTEYAAFDDFYTGKYIIPTNPTEDQLKSKVYQAAIAGDWDEVRERSHSDFVYYGIKDTYLIKRIDESKNFTVLMSMVAEKMGVQIGDSLGTVKPWSQYLSNRSIGDMKVMPKKQEFDSPNVVGGYVRPPNTGKHKWVLSADVNSMYPLLGMVASNMSPETYVPKYKLPDDLKEVVLTYFNDQDEGARLEIPEEIWDHTTRLLEKHDLALAVNGAVFRKDTPGIIPVMVQDIYDSRKAAKKTQFKYEQRKILISEIIKEKSK